jgi:hypothetical protein
MSMVRVRRGSIACSSRSDTITWPSGELDGRSVGEREAVGHPNQVKQRLYAPRAAQEQELAPALRRAAGCPNNEVDAAGINEVKLAEVKDDRLSVTIQCRRQDGLELVCGGEIQLPAWLYDVPVGIDPGADLELGGLPNLELFGEAHSDTSALEFVGASSRRPGAWRDGVCSRSGCAAGLRPRVTRREDSSRFAADQDSVLLSAAKDFVTR